MNAQLDTLLRHPGVWRGDRLGATERPGRPTGHADLDALLPGGGWPRGALTELICQEEGIGELSMLLPALAVLSREGRWIALVAPPYIPYAPALAGAGVDLARLLVVRTGNTADTLWAMEETLRSGACGAVLAWPSMIDERSQRRLQLAAEAGDSTCIWFTPARQAATASFAALRIKVMPARDGTGVHIVKRRGGGPAPTIILCMKHASLCGLTVHPSPRSGPPLHGVLHPVGWSPSPVHEPSCTSAQLWRRQAVPAETPPPPSSMGEGSVKGSPSPSRGEGCAAARVGVEAEVNRPVLPDAGWPYRHVG